MRFGTYRDMPTGRFENAENLHPTLEKTSHKDWWTYRPRVDAPMRFIGPYGDVIEPDEFITDLGTIPRLFRIGRLLQPDGLPAVALIHDWIVRQNNCGANQFSFEQSIRIQQIALKTWMQANPRDRSKTVFYLSRLALRTNRSRRGWNYRFARCPPTLEALVAAQASL